MKVNWKLPQGPRRLPSSCSWKPPAGLWCRYLWSRDTGRGLWFPVMIWIFWWKRHHHQCNNVIIIVTCWSACNSWGWRSVAILTWPKRRVPIQGWMRISLYLWQRQSIREGVNAKKNVFFRALPEWWGGGLPMPEFFGPLSISAFLVNKKSLFLQKCQCIELLTVF